MSSHAFTVMIRPAILPGGELWFPQRLSAEFLEVQRARDPYFFSCSYLNDPIPPEEQRFRPEWIVYVPLEYRQDTYPRVVMKKTGEEKPVFVTTTVDPAISDRRYSDYTGIVTVGCDPDDIWYILSARRVKGGLDVLLNEIVKEIRQYSPRTVGIEAVAFQIALKDALEREFAERYIVGVSLESLKSGTGRGKRARIEALVPRFAEGRVFLRQGIGTELETELREWTPVADMAHDDLVDALSHQLSISYPAPRSGLLTPTMDLFDVPPWERWKFRRDRDREDRGVTGYGF